MMAQAAMDHNDSTLVAYQCLLHDGPEAYLGDVAGPLKIYFPEYKAAEEHAWRTMARVFKVSEVMHPHTKYLDGVSFRSEKKFLLNRPDEGPLENTWKMVYPWSRKTSFLTFLDLYRDLKPMDAPSYNEAKALEFARNLIPV